MINNLIFWWSVVSTVIGVILLCSSIWLYAQSRNEQKRKNAQVKIWMQDANGISLALQRIVQDNLDKRYSSTNDMANAVWAIQAVAFSLYESLYEERVITEEEYKELQKEYLNELKKVQTKGVTDSKTDDSKKGG